MRAREHRGVKPQKLLTLCSQRVLNNRIKSGQAHIYSYKSWEYGSRRLRRRVIIYAILLNYINTLTQTCAGKCKRNKVIYKHYL